MKVDEQVRSLLPAKIREQGFILAGTGADYPPLEFVDESGKLSGFHADEVRALEQLFGVEIRIKRTTFDALIPGLLGARYALGIAGASIKPARVKVVDFVNDINGGDAVAVRTSDNNTYPSRERLCGHIVGVGKGTIEATRAHALAKVCAREKLGVLTVQTYPDQQKALLALRSGRVDATISPGAALAWAVLKNPAVGKIVKSDLFPKGHNGLMIRKDSGLQKAMAAGINRLIADGIYAKMVAKWNLEPYAVDRARLNLLTSG